MEYKGYTGVASFDMDAKVFYGRVDVGRDVITFEAPDVGSIIHEFRCSVDDYLEFCEQQELEPEPPSKEPNRFYVTRWAHTHGILVGEYEHGYHYGAACDLYIPALGETKTLIAGTHFFQNPTLALCQAENEVNKYVGKLTRKLHRATRMKIVLPILGD